MSNRLQNRKRRYSPGTTVSKIVNFHRIGCWDVTVVNMTQTDQVYAICCRPEEAGDVVSGENVKTIEGYAVFNFEVVSFSSFRDNKTRKAHKLWD